MVSWCKKGNIMHKYHQIRALWFKRANTHNTCVHDSMWLANLSPNPCLMWLHYIWYRIKLGPKIPSLRPL